MAKFLKGNLHSAGPFSFIAVHVDGLEVDVSAAKTHLVVVKIISLVVSAIRLNCWKLLLNLRSEKVQV